MYKLQDMINDAKASLKTARTGHKLPVNEKFVYYYKGWLRALCKYQEILNEQTKTQERKNATKKK